MIREGRMKGYLAYSDLNTVGWCNANDRQNYERLIKVYDLDHEPEKKVCSIVCFLVSPDHRRKGIARAMLERVISDYTSMNYDYLPLRLGTAAALLHAFRVLVFAFGRTKPFLNFDVRPYRLDMHEGTCSWTGVYFATTLAALGIMGVIIIWRLRRRAIRNLKGNT
jgi:GNAT superfamily N-acetyltransferase